MQNEVLKLLEKFKVDTGTGSKVFNYEQLKHDVELRFKLQKLLRTPDGNSNNFGDVFVMQDFVSNITKVNFAHNIYTYVAVLSDGRILTNTVNDGKLSLTDPELVVEFFVECLEKVTLYENVYDFLKSCEVYGTLTSKFHHLQEVVNELKIMLNEDVSMPVVKTRNEDFYRGRNAYMQYLRNGKNIFKFRSETLKMYCSVFSKTIEDTYSLTLTGNQFEEKYLKYLNEYKQKTMDSASISNDPLD